MVIRIKEGTEERYVWPIRNRILDVHRVGQTGWPEKFKVQVEVNPRKKPHVMEMGKLLRWLKKMGVHEQIKVECEPPSANSNIQSDASILATFRTSTGWKVNEMVLKRWMPKDAISAEGLKNDLEETD